jgi:hypothetical protein
MLNRSAKTQLKWKKRISELVSKDSAQALSTLLPEFQELFGVEMGTPNVESGLKPPEAEARIEAALISMLTTFGVRNKVYPLIVVLIEALYNRA